MKLRNKKTGRIVNFRQIAFDEPKDDRENYRYSSLAEFNKEWEDAKDTNAPSMPLIKDKKIRKVVRAWAEVNNAYDISYDEGEDCIYVPYGSDNTDTNVCITFDNYNVFKVLEHRKLYTVTELCGEEEE